MPGRTNCSVLLAALFMTLHFSPCAAAPLAGIRMFQKHSSAVTSASQDFNIRSRSFLHASIACATHGVPLPASATQLPCALLVLAVLAALPRHILHCPIFHHWVDLNLYSAACASTTSIAQLTFRLALAPPLCMRAAIVVNIAIWASGRVWHGSRCTPHDLFTARLKELALNRNDCRRSLP